MAAKKGLIGAVVAVVVIVAAGWFGGNYYATNKFGEALEKYIQRHDLKGKVSWSDYKASILGHAEINNVEVSDKAHPETALKIEKISFRHYEENDDRRLVDADLSKVTDKQGKSILLIDPSLKELGYESLEPADILFLSDQNVKANKLKFGFSLVQNDLMNVVISGNLSNTNTFIEAATERSKEFESNPIALMTLLQNVSVNNLHLIVNDAGLIKRILAKATKSQEEITQATSKCVAGLSKLGLEGAQSKCESILAFATGKQKQLSFSVEPTQAVTFKQVFDVAMGLNFGGPNAENAKFFNSLNLNITN